MRNTIIKRIEALEQIRMQGICDRVRVTMKDGSTRECYYFEPVIDGTFDNIIKVELLEGFGVGAEVLEALTVEGDEE